MRKGGGGERRLIGHLSGRQQADAPKKPPKKPPAPFTDIRKNPKYSKMNAFKQFLF